MPLLEGISPLMGFLLCQKAINLSLMDLGENPFQILLLILK